MRSALQVFAEESMQIRGGCYENFEGFMDISSLRFEDARPQLLSGKSQGLDAYFLRDWIGGEYTIGEPVECCLKLATKPNKNCKGKKRTVHVQTWNAKKISKA